MLTGKKQPQACGGGQNEPVPEADSTRLRVELMSFRAEKRSSHVVDVALACWYTYRALCDVWESHVNDVM